MNHFKSPVYQIGIVLSGFSLMMVLLAVLYFMCAQPLPSDKIIWKKDFFELCSYLLPCAAAICVGGGFFIKNPPVSLAGPVNQTSGAADDGADRSARFFYISSLPLLYAGIVAYTLCHPCRLPAFLIVCMSFVWSILCLLFAKAYSVNSPTRCGIIWRYILKFLVLVALALVAIIIIYFRDIFG